MIMVSLMTGKKLGEAKIIKQGRRFKLRFRQRVHGCMHTVSRKGQRKYGVLDWPYGSAMVRIRIEGRVPGGKRSDSPPREEIVGHYASDQARDERFVHDTADQAMPRIGPDGPDLPLILVQAHGEVAFVLHPEGFVEALF